MKKNSSAWSVVSPPSRTQTTNNNQQTNNNKQTNNQQPNNQHTTQTKNLLIPIPGIHFFIDFNKYNNGITTRNWLRAQPISNRNTTKSSTELPIQEWMLPMLWVLLLLLHFFLFFPCTLLHRFNPSQLSTEHWRDVRQGTVESNALCPSSRQHFCSSYRLFCGSLLPLLYFWHNKRGQEKKWHLLSSRLLPTLWWEISSYNSSRSHPQHVSGAHSNLGSDSYYWPLVGKRQRRENIWTTFLCVLTKIFT